MPNKDKITYKFYVEAVWSDTEQKFVEYKNCEVIGNPEILGSLLSEIALGSPVIATVIATSFRKMAEQAMLRGMQLRQAKVPDEVVTKEAKKPDEIDKPKETGEKSILDMTPEEVKEYIRRKNAGK